MNETAGTARQQLPTRTFDTIWHVGTLDPAYKRAWSHEGQGLSVSEHPDEWPEIARLGGNPTWEFTRPGNRFLDYHALTPTQREAITDWGIAHGYVAMREVFAVSIYDEEAEDTFTTYFLDRGEAEDEAFSHELDGGANDQVVETILPVATDDFPDATVRAGEIDPHQVLTAVWVEAEHPDLDGVWWDDRYDPAMLSCPRGVIAPARVPAWTVRQTAAA